jgi:hypothetical protein
MMALVERRRSVAVAMKKEEGRENDKQSWRSNVEEEICNEITTGGGK